MVGRQQKQEVRMGGETYEVIAPEEAEKIIREAYARNIVATALEQADENHDGQAVLDLGTGKIKSTYKESGESFRPGDVLLQLFEVSAEDIIAFHPPIVGGIIGVDEAKEIVERESSGALPSDYPFEQDDIEANHVDAYLDAKGAGESFESRWCDSYLFEHGDDPDPAHILQQARQQLDEVYGSAE